MLVFNFYLPRPVWVAIIIKAYFYERGNMHKEQEENLDQIEENLIKEDQEKRKEDMPVSGKSVFGIKKIKDDNRQWIVK